MTYTPPAHSPYPWSNAPSTSTPLNKANLEAAEQDQIDYTQQVAQDVAAKVTAGTIPPPASVVSVPQSGVAGNVPKDNGNGTYSWVSPKPRSGPLRFMALGDSLSANAMDPHFGGGVWQYNKSWPLWAQLLSGGKLRFTGLSALGGTTASQVASQCLPGILGAAIKPDYCTVLAGVNNVNGLSNSQILTADLGFADIQSICQQLTGAGITPILCTVPGFRNAGSGTGGDPWNASGVLRLNNFIRRYAEQIGVPLADFYAACADPTVTLGAGALSGTWKANYLNQAASDALHPGGIGAVAMAQELVNAVGVAESTDPQITTPFYNNDQLNLLVNPLNLTNASPGPYPDGWTLDTAGTGVTHSCITDATVYANLGRAIRGKWWRIQKTVNDTTQLTQVMNLTNYVAGQIVRVSGLLKVNSIGDATSFIQLALNNNNAVQMFDPNTVPASSQQIAASQQTTLVPAIHLQRDADGGAIGPNVPGGSTPIVGPFVLEAVLPAGLGGSPFVYLRLQAVGAVLDVQLAELQVEVFSAAGIP